MNDLERRRALTRLVLELYMEMPIAFPPGAFDNPELQEWVARVAETGPILDLDRIVTEGARVLSVRIAAAHQAAGS